MELGLHTFGDVYSGQDGQALSHSHIIRNVLAEAEIADRVGLDFFGVGEHHRPDYAISAPETLLAGIATRTDRIKLGSAVTVLSSDDPVRVFQRFTTLNALAPGRIEAVLGRGSFTESFALFGYSLEHYEELFEEKLQLFSMLRSGNPVTWSGAHRTSMTNQAVYPPFERGRLPTWVGVGGSTSSVVRAARHGLPLMIAVIGGPVVKFAPLVNTYRHALERFGHPKQAVAVHSPGYIAETDEQARAEYFPHYRAHMEKIGRERGWPSTSRASFEAGCSSEGALFVGSPNTVAQKIIWATRTLNLNRFDLKYSLGALPHEQMMNSITLFGTKVAPLVRETIRAPET